MKMYRRTLIALMLAGALFGVHAESFKDASSVFADSHAARIEVHSDALLVDAC
jgi:hypothetical protein